MTCNDKLEIAAMAMDLKRVSLGLQRGSFTMAERFLKEARSRKKDLNLSSYPQYIIKLVQKVSNISLDNKDQVSEDCLMYSTLLQNFAGK